MKDDWFADNRDLVKWGVLLRLADLHKARTVLQIAYYRPGPRCQAEVSIDGNTYTLPRAVLQHFRRLKNAEAIESGLQIKVIDDEWRDRISYHDEVLRRISELPGPSIIFLDPDTGLEPQSRGGLEHVGESELRGVWEALRPGDVLVFYQHRTRNKDWIDKKKQQFESAIGVSPGAAKLAHSAQIASDVVFFLCSKDDSI